MRIAGWWLWMFLLGLTGCLPDPLSVDSIPRLEPRIVVSTQWLPDQRVVVLLTTSFGALEASGDSDPSALLNAIAINDAVVIIQGRMEVDTLDFFGTGVYRSNPLALESGEEYELRIYSPTLGSVSARAPVKSPVTFESLTARINDTGFDTLATITYSFKDLAGESYYMVNVQKVSMATLPEPEDFLNPSIFTSLLRDRDSSDGEVLQDTFNVLFQDDFTPGDTLLVQLANISREYYDFVKLRQETRFNFADFLGEPVNYPSNVSGGLGWFTLHLPDVELIVISE